MRSLCCKGLNNGVNGLAANAFKELECGKLNGYLCTAVKYSKRRDVVLQAYHILSELRFCNGCYRKPFNVNATRFEPKQQQIPGTRTTLQRKKRLFDLATWLYGLNDFNRLNIHDVSLEDENCCGARIRKLMFIGEGLMQCTVLLSKISQ